MAQVRCYAGSGFPERPTAFEWQGRWLQVLTVPEQWRTPGGRHFQVLAEDGLRYALGWDEATDEWTVRSEHG
jgi:hypothetical protein